MLQGAQDAVFGSCDRRWEIAGDSMLCHPGFYGGQGGIVCFHYIVTETTMDVNVDKARCKDQVRIVKVARVKGKVGFNTGADGDDFAVVDCDEREIDSFQRRE